MDKSMDNISQGVDGVNARVAGHRAPDLKKHTPDDYEIEFADPEGETIDVPALRMGQFIIVWRTESGQWVSVSEQVSDMIEGRTPGTKIDSKKKGPAVFPASP
jgi:hypothetical protein